MFDNISIINAVYQLIVIAVWIGFIFLVVSFVRNSRENKKRLKRLEEKVDYLTKKIDKSN
ncbi:hypothetical protein AWH56_011620 [Anaerobacillus isosaccharinicus]|uniref:DUF4083 domain-containing protein n=1 Tax=Anaerobacillus isosaccharinicus TaxID=1532552 RepID=A0A1S2LYC4_9BACI|nr:hypothetical protein [Anaerobacillus isosaccharinicus]MBA5588452.1 hypothetical protein [Anaerobacillus isosaccharinicus]QOY38121.1 hypothetical protein AWH56_011620 [Anaerobacillus isosaccharinicus]